MGVIFLPREMVVVIGKWSLPCRWSEMDHVEFGTRDGVTRVRSTCVNVLCVEKCVGRPSFKIARPKLVAKCSTILPRLLHVLEPHEWLHELKSPVRMMGLLIPFKIQSRSLRENCCSEGI